MRAQLISVLLVACVPAKTPSESRAEIRAHGCGELRTVRRDGARAFGPDIDLTEAEGAYRGFVRNQPTQMRLSEDRIDGMIGSERVEMVARTDRTPEGAAVLDVRGMLQGRLAWFRLSRDRLTGRVGERGFDMERDPTRRNVYTSSAACARPYPISELEIPEDFEVWQPNERALMLSLALL
jgi:hypothetical protein